MNAGSDSQNWSDILSRVTAASLALVLSAATILMPFWYWDGGLLEVETTGFIQQYLDERGVARNVFDPHRNDLDTYQARELSYLVDYLDARGLQALMARGHAVFVPASAICASVLTVIVFLLAIRRYDTLRPPTAALLLLLYLTNYVHVVTMGMLYRSAKPMLAPLTMAAAFYIAALVQDSSREGRTGSRGMSLAPAVVFVLLCLMSLLDRQGFFLALTGFGVLALNAAFTGGRRDVVVGAAAAVAAMVFYNLVGAPLIVESLNGYRPSFEYQRIPLESLASPRLWLQAGSLLLQAGSVLGGGVPVWLVAGLALAAGAWAVYPRSSVPRRAALLFGSAALAQLVMFAGMVARHPPIYEYADHRLWYYPLPLQALLLVSVVVALGFASATWTRLQIVALNLVLGAAVVSNVVHWNGYRDAQLRSLWFPTVYEQSAALKSSLAGSRPLWYLTPPYRGFYQFSLSVSPVFRARADTASSHEAP